MFQVKSNEKKGMNSYSYSNELDFAPKLITRYFNIFLEEKL